MITMVLSESELILLRCALTISIEDGSLYNGAADPGAELVRAEALSRRIERGIERARKDTRRRGS